MTENSMSGEQYTRVETTEVSAYFEEGEPIPDAWKAEVARLMNIDFHDASEAISYARDVVKIKMSRIVEHALPDIIASHHYSACRHPDDD